MIWVGGRVVSDEALTISVLDRTFEHGLGLFETMRTWRGRAPLLARHLARLSRSARELGLPLDPSALPDDRAVSELLESEAAEGDRVLRVTLSGGLDQATCSTVWMRTAPLPPPMPGDGAVVELGTWQVGSRDPLARHKSLNYWTRRIAYESSRRAGFDEALFMTPEGDLQEGSRTNLFFLKDDVLITPGLVGPLVPGIMRSLVLERARALALRTSEVPDLRLATLAEADEIFLTNSVRGIVPVARLVVTRPSTSQQDWRAPGPWTQRLMTLLADWFERHEESPA